MSRGVTAKTALPVANFCKYDITREGRYGKQLEKTCSESDVPGKAGSENPSSRDIQIIVSCVMLAVSCLNLQKATNPASWWPEDARIGAWESQNDLLNVNYLIFN